MTCPRCTVSLRPGHTGGLSCPRCRSWWPAGWFARTDTMKQMELFG